MGTRGRPRHLDVLTPAEWRVVDAVRHGMSNREIARRRGISLDAVKFHIANALRKLGLDQSCGSGGVCPSTVPCDDKECRTWQCS